jgi:hypothetical protein
MSDDTHDLEGEVMRLRDVTDERLTQIRLSVDRRLGTIEQNQGFIERNTQDIYRVLALLAWKQILFSNFIYWCCDIPLLRGWLVAGLPLICTKRAEH